MTRLEAEQAKTRSEIMLKAQKLYRMIPGAPRVPTDPEEGFALWGEVEHTDHWGFAVALATEFVEMRNAIEGREAPKSSDKTEEFTGVYVPW